MKRNYPFGLGEEFVSKYDGTSSKEKKTQKVALKLNLVNFRMKLARVGLMSDSMSEGINLQGASVLIN